LPHIIKIFKNLKTFLNKFFAHFIYRAVTCKKKKTLTAWSLVVSYPFGSIWVVRSNPTRGQCYDHNFLHFSPILGTKYLLFSYKRMLSSNFCKNWQYFAQNATFSIFFGENIFKNHNIGSRIVFFKIKTDEKMPFVHNGHIFLCIRTLVRTKIRVGPIEIFLLERVCLCWSSKHFWRKKPCKKSADLHPRQGYLQQRNSFTGLNRTPRHNTK
jgi:hypothetical protein